MHSQIKLSFTEHCENFANKPYSIFWKAFCIFLYDLDLPFLHVVQMRSRMQNMDTVRPKLHILMKLAREGKALQGTVTLRTTRSHPTQIKTRWSICKWGTKKGFQVAEVQVHHQTQVKLVELDMTQCSPLVAECVEKPKTLRVQMQ